MSEDVFADHAVELLGSTEDACEARNRIPNCPRVADFLVTVRRSCGCSESALSCTLCLENFERWYERPEVVAKGWYCWSCRAPGTGTPSLTLTPIR